MTSAAWSWGLGTSACKGHADAGTSEAAARRKNITFHRLWLS